MEAVQVYKPATLGFYLVKEWDPDFNRESVTFLAGSGAVRNIASFTVLGLIPGAITGVTSAAAAGNTGNGTFTLDATPTGNGIKPGQYLVTCIEPATNLGTFSVEDPDGIDVGIARVGTLYTGPVRFTIADGATDFVAGDRFVVTVPQPAAGKFVPLDYAATNGAQNAAAVALFPVTVPDGSDEIGTVMRRGPALGIASSLVWPSGATAAQIATGLAQLAALGIVHR
jgi:hypothetical protein